MLPQKTPIAREGYPFIGIAGLITLVLALLGYQFLALLSLIVTLFILYFFRDPERFIPVENDILISPADGKIIRIEKVFDERFFGEEVQKISIFMNIFNVHVNRTPISGTVEKIAHTPGKFYSADSDKGGLQNENCATIIVGNTGRRIAVVQVAGLIARRIVCWLEPEDKVKQGMRFGLIRFGSRVDIYVPGPVEIRVANGQIVRAGETILGHLLA